MLTHSSTGFEVHLCIRNGRVRIIKFSGLPTSPILTELLRLQPESKLYLGEVDLTFRRTRIFFQAGRLIKRTFEFDLAEPWSTHDGDEILQKCAEANGLTFIGE